MEFNTGGTADSSNSGAMTGGTMASSMYKNGGGVGRFKVGVFNEQQLRNKEDKKAVEKAQRETGLKYVDTKMIKKGGKMYLEVYLIPNEEYYESSKFAKGGGLKPIPKGNKGLPKLPKSVRNKMGYMAKGGGVESEYIVTLQNADNGELLKLNVIGTSKENAVDNAYMEADLNQPYEVYSVKKMAKGGGVKANEHFRLKGVEFLKDDLEKLEQAIKDNNNEEIQRFFSYWGQHLNMLENKNNKRMYNFLEDDLAKLEKSIQQNNQEEIDKFFSYWSYHISSLKMAKGGGVGKSLKEKYANLNYQIQSADSGWIKNNSEKYENMISELRKLHEKIYGKGRISKMEWGGTAESSETGEFIGGENQSSMFENGGVSTGFTYDIGGL